MNLIHPRPFSLSLSLFLCLNFDDFESTQYSAYLASLEHTCHARLKLIYILPPSFVAMSHFEGGEAKTGDCEASNKSTVSNETNRKLSSSLSLEVFVQFHTNFIIAHLYRLNKSFASLSLCSLFYGSLLAVSIIFIRYLFVMCWQSQLEESQTTKEEEEREGSCVPFRSNTDRITHIRTRCRMRRNNSIWTDINGATRIADLARVYTAFVDMLHTLQQSKLTLRPGNDRLFGCLTTVLNSSLSSYLWSRPNSLFHHTFSGTDLEYRARVITNMKQYNRLFGCQMEWLIISYIDRYIYLIYFLSAK